MNRALHKVGLPSESCEDSTLGLLEGVLSCYGEPGEVLPDRGRESMEEFNTLLMLHESTHRLASREHPQSNGLA